MKTKIMQYIDWIDAPYWNCKLILGDRSEYYNFSANWNSRDESFMITIASSTDEIIIESRKLVLNVDLFNHCYSSFKPKCSLIPVTDHKGIRRITYEHMINGEVKLYHVILKS